MIQDHRIDWMRKRVFYTADDINGTVALQGTLETGVTELEISASGVKNYVMIAGEHIAGARPVPIDLDPQFPVGYRVHYTAIHNSGTATASWILLNKFTAEGIVIALAATALDTPIPLLDAYTDSNGAASTTDALYQISGRGIDDNIGITREAIENGAMMGISLEADAITNFTTVGFLFLEMDYVPMRTLGTGSNLDRALQSDGVA